MVLDYDYLKTWKTPDLVYRYSKLVKKTQVLGISEKAAIIHVVALVCTSGASLPINVAFSFWHACRYSEVKQERMWIRQILGIRNMAYQGNGHWVNFDPNLNGGQGPQVNGVVQQDNGRNDAFERVSCAFQVLSFCEAPQGTTT